MRCLPYGERNARSWPTVLARYGAKYSSSGSMDGLGGAGPDATPTLPQRAPGRAQPGIGSLNEFGSRAATVVWRAVPRRLPSSTGMSGPHSSAMTCRHAPHGLTGPGVSAITASAAKSPGLQPAAMAANSAVRSAQLHGP